MNSSGPVNVREIEKEMIVIRELVLSYKLRTIEGVFTIEK